MVLHRRERSRRRFPSSAGEDLNPPRRARKRATIRSRDASSMPFLPGRPILAKPGAGNRATYSSLGILMVAPPVIVRDVPRVQPRPTDAHKGTFGKVLVV